MSINIRPLDRDAFLDVRRLLARANDAPYEVSAVADEKCFGEGVAGDPTALGAFREGELAGVAVFCGKHLRLIAVDRAHRRRGVGTELLEAVEALMSDAGADQANVAAEPGNYFVPGIFEHDCQTQRFFEKRGYERRPEEPLNLAASLAQPFGENGEGDIRRADAREREPVVRFVAEHFGTAWAFETLRAFDAPEPTVIIAVPDGVLSGFAAFEANNRGLGTFGPLGVRKEMRGRDLGAKLVVAALNAMRILGYAQAIIPWTSAVEFYRRACGAVVAHRFIRYGKAL
ncbi:MAG TPA: GNAT family N-acetyltransferase [Thermoanaerobaculia bacterium]